MEYPNIIRLLNPKSSCFESLDGMKAQQLLLIQFNNRSGGLFHFRILCIGALASLYRLPKAFQIDQ